MTDTKTDEKKPTVANDMAQRRTFYPERDDSGEVITTALEQAQEYIAGCMKRFDDFGAYDFAAPGTSIEGEGDEAFTVFDESVYADDMGVIVGTLTGKLADGKTRGIKCIFMAPIPDIDAMTKAATDDTLTQKWAKSILEKEANHVAVRPLRDAEDVSTVVDEMPSSLTAYTDSGRAAGAGIMGTFNDLYKQINATLADAVPAWAKQRFIKSELKKAMESAAYASEYYAPIEDRPNRKNGESGSLFVIACELGVNAAKKKGLDPTVFERWLATRDEKEFKVSEEGDLDTDSLLDDMFADAEPEADTNESDEADTEEADDANTGE